MQGKYAEAGPLYERSQAIREKALGPEHPNVAAVLNAQASLLQIQVGLLTISERSRKVHIRSVGVYPSFLNPSNSPSHVVWLCCAVLSACNAEVKPLYELC